MHLECIECSTPISAENMNLQTLLAKCRRCNEVFSFAEQLGRKPVLPVPAGRPPVEMPKGLEIFREGKRLLIERSWFGCSVLPLLGFTLFWDGFMVMWFGIALTQGEWLMALFGTFHGLIGLGLAYACLTAIFNVTTLKVEGGRLTIEHGPIPYPGGQDLDVREIEQLYVKRGLTGSQQGNESFELHAVLANRAHIQLVESLPDSAQALFLEQELESFLGIVDEPVAGELERGTTGLALSRRGPGPARIPSFTTRTPSSRGAAVDDAPLPEGAVDVSALATGEDARCPVCGDPVGEPAVQCPSCSTLHHPECWRYSDGCATYACGG